LAKSGYGGGDPKKIAEMDADWVINLLEYENFCQDFESETTRLNSER